MKVLPVPRRAARMPMPTSGMSSFTLQRVSSAASSPGQNSGIGLLVGGPSASMRGFSDPALPDQRFFRNS